MVIWTLRSIGIFSISLLLIISCSYPKKPELRGTEELAIQIDADKLITPEYHNPLEEWRPRHMQAIKDNEFTERECMSCHDIETSCNNCHQYVGVPVVERYSAQGFMPGEDRVKLAVNGITP